MKVRIYPNKLLVLTKLLTWESTGMIWIENDLLEIIWLFNISDLVVVEDFGSPTFIQTGYI